MLFYIDTKCPMDWLFVRHLPRWASHSQMYSQRQSVHSQYTKVYFCTLAITLEATCHVTWVYRGFISVDDSQGRVRNGRVFVYKGSRVNLNSDARQKCGSRISELRRKWASGDTNENTIKTFDHPRLAVVLVVQVDQCCLSPIPGITAVVCLYFQR